MTWQSDLFFEYELPEITKVSGKKIGGRDVLVGRIAKINSKGIEVDAGDRGLFQIPIEEVFLRPVPPVVCEMVTITQHPTTLSLSEIVCFVDLGDATGSRKKVAEVERQEIQKMGCRRYATITELTHNWIFATDAFGLEYRLNTLTTFTLIASVYGAPRLRLYSSGSTGPEPLWLYPDDRVMLSAAAQNTNQPFFDAEIVIRGVMQNGSPDKLMNPVELSKIARLPYDTVLVLGCEGEMSGVKQALQEEFPSAQVTRYKGDVLQQTASDNGDEGAYVLAVIPASCDYVHVATNVDNILATYKYVDLVIAAEDVVAEEYVAQFRSVLTEDRFKGVWHVASGFFGLLSTIDSHDLRSSVEMDNNGYQTMKVGSLANANHILEDAETRKLAKADSIVTCLDENIKGVLEALIKACSKYPSETASILFEIHRSGHSVQILSAVGNKEVVQGFRNVREHLHKSPVRDLGVGGRDSDTSSGHAPENMRRFLYFLDALEGSVHKAKTDGVKGELSTLGLRINSPVDHSIWVVFLVSRRASGFLPRTSEQVVIALTLVERALVSSRIALKTATDARKLLWFGVEANDYQFFAHEAQAYVDAALTEFKKCVNDGKTLTVPDIQGIANSLTDASSIYSQLCPELRRRSELTYNVIKPHEVAERVINVETQKHPEFATRIKTSYEGLDGRSLYGRPLALVSTLRNLVSNSINQIMEYGCNNGEIRLRFVLLVDHVGEQRGNLVVFVGDDGPGIHRRYKNEIFLPGVTSRKNGHGMGLAASVRLLEKCKNGAALFLTESIMYHGTTFAVVLPVSIMR